MSSASAKVGMRTGTFAHRELWTTLAHMDLRARYRGSVLGPFWLTLTTGAMIGGVGFLYGGLFGQPLADYIPYIAVSIVLWTFISGCLSEGVAVFFTEGLVLRQLPVPASIFITRLLYRNILIFLHNAIIIGVVFALYPPGLTLDILMAPLGLALLAVNLWWMCLVVGILGARYRDFSPIVNSLVQIMFFLTPVIWNAEALPDRAIFVDANPFYHLIEIVRRPLLSEGIPGMSFALAGGMAVLGTMFAVRLLGWSRPRLVYWL